MAHESSYLASPQIRKQALNSPLYVPDPEALLRKLGNADGLLAHYWRDFRERILTDEKQRASMIYLLALTGDDVVEECHQRLTEWLENDMAVGDTANATQFHTWCRCGGITRRVAFFDWLWHRGAWTEEEIDRAADILLGFAFKHPYAVLEGRTRSSDNQALSMILNVAVIGFIFGYKLRERPLAKYLFDYGMGRLSDIIGLFPPDGYSGEGSTYTSHVNTPLFYWTCEFLHHLIGERHLDTPFAPNGTTMRRILRMEMHLMSPGGLLAPWDNHGWHRAKNASPFAYLAAIEDDPAYLAMIEALNMWGHPGMLAWGHDDPMWTLLWWPADYATYDQTALSEGHFGWYLPNTGGALDDVQHTARLMQVWDRCGDRITGVGRPQFNPNHVMVDYASEPVFQDGLPVPNTDPFKLSEESIFSRLDQEERERLERYETSPGSESASERLRELKAKVAAGLLPAANAIVVDEDEAFFPGGARTGHPEFYGKNKHLQAVTADCANFYQPGTDITLSRRTSLWTSRGFGLIVDTLRAGSSHTWRWQALLRAQASMQEQTIQVELCSGRKVLLAWDDIDQARTTDIENFPKNKDGEPPFESRCCRLELLREGTNSSFAVLIAPEAEKAAIRRVEEHGVEVEVDGERHFFVIDNFARETQPLNGDSTDAFVAWKAESEEPVEIKSNVVDGEREDTRNLADIEEERTLQSPFDKLIGMDGGGTVAPETSSWSDIDACFVQLVAEKPDVVLLREQLNNDWWPASFAAAETLGRLGVEYVDAETMKALRDKLAAEHEISKKTLYPAIEPEPAVEEREERGKRWRLKASLVAAIGRLRDPEAVPLLGQIISDNCDFYVVYSQAARALGRIKGTGTREALEPALADSEKNTRERAQDAMPFCD